MISYFGCLGLRGFLGFGINSGWFWVNWDVGYFRRVDFRW